MLFPIWNKENNLKGNPLEEKKSYYNIDVSETRGCLTWDIKKWKEKKRGRKKKERRGRRFLNMHYLINIFF